MAGGKETPRQKLVGLMYLVLLALLALQVSSAIIQKFQFLNSSLEKAVTEAEVRNIETIAGMKVAVENGKNQKKDLLVLLEAEKVRKTTREMMDYINELKQELIEKTGGLNEEGYPAGGKDEETVANIMLGVGDTKNGQAYALKTELNKFTNTINASLKSVKEKKRFGSIALDAKEDPVFKNDKEQRRKDFAHVNFESTPLVAALAVLSEKTAQLTSIEADVLNSLAKKVGMARINVDRLRPVVLSQSNKVVAGTKFEGEMFMAAYHSSLKPEMTFQNKEVKVNDQGVAGIEFRASGGNYDPNGLAKKTWTGTIKYPKPGGGDSVYVVKYDYYVVKPVIQVQGEATDLLYKNCGNVLNVQVPALGVDYNPTFTVTGGTIRNTSTTGEIIVIPNSPHVTINISSNGTFIGSVKFKVKLIPQPNITMTKGNRPYVINQIRGVSVSTLRELSVKVFAESAFKSSNPRDAIYKIKEWNATLVRGRRVIKKRSYNSENKSLKGFLSEARSGDRLVVEILDVRRKTFKQTIDRVTIPSSIFSIPIQ
jgi:gliding motility-associated protein GldM